MSTHQRRSPTSKTAEPSDPVQLRARFRHTGNIAALQAAIDLLSDEHLRLGDTMPLRRVRERALALRDRYAYTGNVADLAEAEQLAEEAATSAASGSADVAPGQSTLAAIKRDRYLRSGDPGDLDAAVGAADAAVAATNKLSPNRPHRLTTLAAMLLQRYRSRGSSDDLDAAIDLHRTAVQAALAIEAAEEPVIRANLAVALLERYLRDGARSALDEAIDHWQHALANTPETSTAWPERADALGIALRTRFERFGDVADLDRAAALQSLAVTKLSTTAVEHARIAAHHGGTLYRRFQRTGLLADLHAAIGAYRDAANTSIGPTYRAAHLTGLGTMLLEEHRFAGDTGALEAALVALQEAVELSDPGTPAYPLRLTNLAIGLRRSFEATGDATALHQAIAHYKQALPLTRPDTNQQADILTNLGIALRERFRVNKQPADLAEALRLHHAALAATPPGSSRWAMIAINIANVHAEHFEASGDPDNRRQAIEWFRVGVEAQQHVAVGAALRQARAWAMWEVDHERYAEAEEPLTVCLRILAELYERQERIPDREEWLAQIQRIPSAATLTAARLHGPAEALRVLDSSRGLLLAEQLAPSHPVTSHDGLRAPDVLAATPDYEPAGSPSAPIIALVAERNGGFALLDDGGVRLIELPDLHLRGLHRRVDAMRGAEAGWRSTARSPTTAVAQLSNTTAWLWDAAIGPVMAALPDARRVHLVPTGLLTALPLHAAWMLDQTRPHGRRYLVDLVDVSYLPRASAFGALRDRERRAGVDRVLVVADPDPFLGPPLAYSWVEAAAISPLFAMTTTLAGTDATSASVTTAARQADVLHFACHARIDSRQPRRSWLQLADGTTVTLGELLEAPLAQSPLVVLSACDTARIGDRAVEEAIGFETGLLRAGARAVVAALWPVTDRFAALLMLRFYEAWRSERRHPAAALSVAQRWLHAATADDLLELLSRRIDLDARPDLGWIVHKHSERSDPLLSWAAFRYTGPMSDDDEGPFIG